MLKECLVRICRPVIQATCRNCERRPDLTVEAVQSCDGHSVTTAREYGSSPVTGQFAVDYVDHVTVQYYVHIGNRH